MSTSIRMMLLAVACPTGCHCPDGVTFETESSTSLSSETSTGTAASSDTSTGEPFDASRWIGRYHYEDAWLEFGERGDPIGEEMLANFEIRADATATMFYESCGEGPPIIIAYRWELGEDGWLHLYPGEGESRLRFMADDTVGRLRAHLGEPCRERLLFEADGNLQAWLDFYPGESCWVDRCTTPNLLQIDYCEGEEPPPCP